MTDVHTRYETVADHLLAAMREDLARLNEADRVALSWWLGERLPPVTRRPVPCGRVLAPRD